MKSFRLFLYLALLLAVGVFFFNPQNIFAQADDPTQQIGSNQDPVEPPPVQQPFVAAPQNFFPAPVVPSAAPTCKADGQNCVQPGGNCCSKVCTAGKCGAPQVAAAPGVTTSAPVSTAAPVEQYQQCSKNAGCPKSLDALYKSRGEKCASSLSEFQSDPVKSHFWIEDPDITALGKSSERGRQFLNWTLTSNAIDNSILLKQIWANMRNIAFILIILVVALMGIGIIIGQRANFNIGVNLWSTGLRIGGVLLYIVFSATIVLILIQLSELLMRLFADSLSAKNLLNIFFGGAGGADNYTKFQGCRDLNIRMVESIKMETFLIKATNISYYTLASMLLARKILLWFLLFVSPFLGLLLPFRILRGIAVIWIEVFFQWLFYGPLVALFLAGTAFLWKFGIPFIFDFSQTGTVKGYVFPTAINIIIGGPGQVLSALNNANNVDTFVEYVITLIMLWGVIIFPWWLLRRIRDHGNGVLDAIKNILLAINGSFRSDKSPQQPLSPSALTWTTPTTRTLSKDKQTTSTVRFENMEDIKKATTSDIASTLNFSARSIQDIARVETDQSASNAYAVNFQNLKDPMKAETTTERVKYTSIRSELEARANKNDMEASHLLSGLSPEVQSQKILSTITYKAPVQISLSSDQINAIGRSVAQNYVIIQSLFHKTNVSEDKIKKLLEVLSQHSQDPDKEKVKSTAEREVGVSRADIDKVSGELKQILAKPSENIMTAIGLIGQEHGLSQSDVLSALRMILPDTQSVSEEGPDKFIDISKAVAIEDYEAVRSMWVNHYEKGEIPTTPDIHNRAEWIEKDVAFLTNTLNKLMSDNLAYKTAGLADVSQILPIFLINNFKGDELLAYLKAKLEAARQVGHQLTTEESIKKQLVAASEEFVDVATPHAEEKKKEMTTEETIDENEIENDKSNSTHDSALDAIVKKLTEDKK